MDTLRQAGSWVFGASSWLVDVALGRARAGSPSEVRNARIGVAAAALLAGYGIWRLARAMQYQMTMEKRIRDGGMVVITGASQGIGRSLAVRLARHYPSCNLALVARNERALGELATEINTAAGREAAAVFPADCGAEADSSRACDAILARADRLGVPVSVLVNCAGAGAWMELWATPVEEVHRAVSAPFMASVWMTRRLLPHMLGNREGSVVCVQSPASRTPFPGSTLYSATRVALRGLASALRADLSATHIRVQEAVLGETASSYFDVNAGARERLPGLSRILPRLSADEAAAAVHRCMLRDVHVHCEPVLLRASLALHAVMPDTVQALVNATGWKATSV